MRAWAILASSRALHFKERVRLELAHYCPLIVFPLSCRVVPRQSFSKLLYLVRSGDMFGCTWLASIWLWGAYVALEHAICL